MSALLDLPGGLTPVLGFAGAQVFSGAREDFLNAGHSEALELQNGTITLGFRADMVADRQGLFSKDGRDFDDGGHLAAWIENGQLKVRQQSTDSSQYITLETPIVAGQSYALAVSFGADGLKVYLDGVLVAAEPTFKQGLEDNARALIFGAHGMWRRDDSEDPADGFDGTLSDMLVFDSALEPDQVGAVAGLTAGRFAQAAEMAADYAALMPIFTQGHHGSEALHHMMMRYDFDVTTIDAASLAEITGSDAAETLSGSNEGEALLGAEGNDTLEGLKGDDLIDGGAGQDNIAGGGGSDVLRGGDGRDMMRGGTGLDLMQGGRGHDTLKGQKGADQLDGGLGNDLMQGGKHDDVLQGGYGNDTLEGGAGHDVLDGGHGEDVLDGGKGNDLLIATSDGREGLVAYDADRDEGIAPGSADSTGRAYAEQPIHADDILIGGAGSDIFYFQTQINARAEYLEKHTQNDGTIRWHGVAGENDNIHDHWVDVIGDDVVMDFSRAEGDRIVIEGHTTQIRSIEHKDSTGDGILDHTVITLYSEQGKNGGAHNQDLLGTITIYGDLVTEEDIEHTAAPAYGIVTTIDQLDEAIRPTAKSVDTGPIQAPTTSAATIDLPDGLTPVLGFSGAQVFSGAREDFLNAGHSEALELQNGTITFSFKADALTGSDALFSKDATGNGEGGHLTAFVTDAGDLKLRSQSQSGETWLVARDVIETGKTYDFAFSFGDEGAYLILDGEVLDYEDGWAVGLEDNTEQLVIGANGGSSAPGELGNPHSNFDGTITDFAVYDTQDVFIFG